jgi:hypothetical protein
MRKSHVSRPWLSISAAALAVLLALPIAGPVRAQSPAGL